ncbi:hypothetical protein [Photobacterium damselae]|uniref:hypothetical protein n=1 Tax=Photobacterium damselae TaxID=38293 RepID=UPI001EE12D44|nr:hypothetical protein [Photobacterium damselae]MCG3826661.1 hypothetical protein [Photobacterium damselae]
MLREYIVDPNSYCRNIDSLQRFLSDFGTENGRVIVSLSNRWEREQQDAIKASGIQLTTLERRKCFDRLKYLAKTSVVSAGSIPSELTEWVDRAKFAQERLGIGAIISSAATLGANHKFDYTNFLHFQPPSWHLEKDATSPRKAEDMANTIKNSLRLASVGLFVDPYFDPAKIEYRRPLNSFVTNIVSGRVACKKVFIHTVEDREKGRSKKELRQWMEELVHPELPAGFCIELWIWPSQLIHDRFILTKNVGYQFGHGWQESGNEMHVNISRLTEQARDREFKKFSNSGPRQGDPIVIVGT